MVKGAKRMRKVVTHELDETRVVRNSRPFGRPRVSLDCSSPLVTKQDFKDAADVNNIMKGYVKTGVISWVNPRTGIYADCSTVGDYQRCLNVVNESKTMFNNLPSELRARFENNPGLLLMFLGDPKNREEAMELGLFEPDEAFKRKKAGLKELPVSGDSKAVSGDSNEPVPAK